jgi:hypothetical protein
MKRLLPVCRSQRGNDQKGRTSRLKETADYKQERDRDLGPRSSKVMVGGMISTVAPLLEEEARCVSARARAIGHRFVGIVLIP